MKTALVNCDVYTGNDVLYDKAVLVQGDSIHDIVPLDKVPTSCEVIDLCGASLAPAFLDVQVNGGADVMFGDAPTVQSLRSIADAHARRGTLNFMPTLLSSPPEVMLQAIEAVRTAREEGLAGVLGLHLEGPYIETEMSGVHDPQFVRPLDDIEFRRVLELGTDVIRMLTVSPGMVTNQHLDALVDRNVRVCIGHTAASAEDVARAFDRGASGVTHLFNGMPPLTGRLPGAVGAVLADRDSWANIIVDGFHVSFISVAAAKAAKRDRLFLVSDAMPPVGGTCADFRVGSQAVTCSGSQCSTEGGLLAGSAIDMATAARNCVQQCGIPKDEALRMASTYPAEFLGVDDRLGRIAPGYIADLVVLNGQLFARSIITRGKYVELD